MIKIGDTVKVFSDPLTCKNFEFTGEVKQIHGNPDSGLLYCRVYDSEYEAVYDRKININNH